jgi:hypothetical protein
VTSNDAPAEETTPSGAPMTEAQRDLAMTRFAVLHPHLHDAVVLIRRPDTQASVGACRGEGTPEDWLAPGAPAVLVDLSLAGY